MGMFGIFGFFKNIVLSLMIIILMALVSVYVFSNTLQATLLEPSFYEKQFEKQDIYGSTQNLIIDSFVNSTDNASEGIAASISKEKVRSALKDVFTKAWIKTELNRLTRNTLGYLKSEKTNLDLSVSIRPRLVMGLTAAASEETGIPPEQLSPGFESVMSENIPEPFELTPVKDMIEDTQLRTGVTLLTSVQPIVPIVMAVLFILIFAISMDVAHFSKIVGIPLLFNGLGLIVTVITLPGLLSNLPIADQALSESVSLFFQPVLNDLLLQAIIIIVASLALLLFGFIYPMVSKKKRR